MAYSTQNYWGFGLSHLLVFLGVETRRFENWICFRPQVRTVEKPTQFGPLKRANPSHYLVQSMRLALSKGLN
jgi:hypothetical protein